MEHMSASALGSIVSISALHLAYLTVDDSWLKSRDNLPGGSRAGPDGFGLPGR